MIFSRLRPTELELELETSQVVLVFFFFLEAIDHKEEN